MVFPSNIGTKQQNSTMRWNGARSAVTSVKTLAQSIVANSPLSLENVMLLLGTLNNAKVILDDVVTAIGLNERAQSELGDPTFDAVAVVTDILSRINTLRDWLLTNFPQDANGWLLVIKFDANGTPVYRTLTGAQETAIKNQITNTILSGID